MVDAKVDEVGVAKVHEVEVAKVHEVEVAKVDEVDEVRVAKENKDKKENNVGKDNKVDYG